MQLVAAPVVTFALTSVSPIRSAAGTRVISLYLARPSLRDQVRERDASSNFHTHTHTLESQCSTVIVWWLQGRYLSRLGDQYVISEQ